MGISCPCFSFLIFLGPVSIGIDLNSFERKQKGTCGRHPILILTFIVLTLPASDFRGNEESHPHLLTLHSSLFLKLSESRHPTCMTLHAAWMSAGRPARTRCASPASSATARRSATSSTSTCSRGLGFGQRLTVLCAPKPKYGGARNLLKAIHSAGVQSLRNRVSLEAFLFCAGNGGFPKELFPVY